MYYKSFTIYSIELNSGILEALNSTGLLLSEIGTIIFCNETCENDKGLLQSSIKAMANYSNVINKIAGDMEQLNSSVNMKIDSSKRQACNYILITIWYYGI